jgi:ribosomal protein S27E
MRYQKEYEVDENMRVVKCPKCENEVFSTKAAHCKLCGTKLFNICNGIPEYDEYGHEINRPIHNNPGNARYCETCGEPTYFFNEGFLKPWEEEKAELEEFNDMDLGEPRNLDSSDDNSEPVDFEDIPF